MADTVITFDPKVAIALARAVPFVTNIVSTYVIQNPYPTVEKAEITKHPEETTNGLHNVTSVILHFSCDIKINMLFHGDEAISLVSFYCGKVIEHQYIT